MKWNQFKGPCALLHSDKRTVGFAIEGEGAFLGRFTEPVDPAVWREVFFDEWKKDDSDGVFHRAVKAMGKLGFELEGVFPKPVMVDPKEGQIFFPEWD